MRAVNSLLKDTALLTIAGIVLGLGANAVSPRGLSLRRDYFAKPSAAEASRPPAGTAAAAPTGAETAVASASHDAVSGWFHDPGRITGRILFVDARSEAHFNAGHIPGARLFDHYRPENTVADVLAAATLAERIVVYCRGGDCEDSELAAAHLIALGIPASKLVVYRAGFTEWQRRGMPVEPPAQGASAPP